MSVLIHVKHDQSDYIIILIITLLLAMDPCDFFSTRPRPWYTRVWIDSKNILSILPVAVSTLYPVRPYIYIHTDTDTEQSQPAASSPLASRLTAHRAHRSGQHTDRTS
ncbi:uncharacterized protein ASPGLDRAFT_521289 [Aspergillus glaucus CBS 516.65]|uniref:Uncharacterized protein n=1 Tax=Aspergillus glaucus CBS 516.65 TaxID=1160497 RepID=A0A1L9VEG9_ASPGL|nr:hypothetical protein ASPGLDRAFT_521289 [Aspergillus glaucus CBS 516.65]OJJ82294.1 hypothetical protein ASPGLDRAFT_521289 [Aspergillus glaucus CBS 516.65]